MKDVLIVSPFKAPDTECPVCIARANEDHVWGRKRKRWKKMHKQLVKEERKAEYISVAGRFKIASARNKVATRSGCLTLREEEMLVIGSIHDWIVARVAGVDCSKYYIAPYENQVAIVRAEDRRVVYIAATLDLRTLCRLPEYRIDSVEHYTVRRLMQHPAFLP